MLHALSDIATKTVGGTTTTLDAAKHFLDCASWNPNAAMLHRASDMTLPVDSDGAHLVAPKARSRAGGYHFLGDSDGKMFNGPICILAKVLKHVTASAAETELGSICINAREGTIFRQTLEEPGHHQAATPIKTGNATARGILDQSMKARHL